jgi:hypothetical protein
MRRHIAFRHIAGTSTSGTSPAHRDYVPACEKAFVFKSLRNAGTSGSNPHPKMCRKPIKSRVPAHPAHPSPYGRDGARAFGRAATASRGLATMRVALIQKSKSFCGSGRGPAGRSSGLNLSGFEPKTWPVHKISLGSELQRKRNSPVCNAQPKDRYRWPVAIQQSTDISTPRRT